MLTKPCCALCWLDGVRSEPVDNWPGFAICRAHLAQSTPPANVVSFQEMRRKLRPPEPGSLAATLANIDAVRLTARNP